MAHVAESGMTADCLCGHSRVCHETNHGVGRCWKQSCRCPAFTPVLHLLPPIPPEPA
jgi:hypothetical protein